MVEMKTHGIQCLDDVVRVNDVINVIEGNRMESGDDDDDEC